MNALARELNGILEGTSAARLLSGIGRALYFPKGIVAQSAEAKQQATRFNATVGMAFQSGSPMILPGLSELLPNLSAGEAVAYAPTSGLPKLRELWAGEIRRKNPDLGKTPISNPTVVPGLTGGISQITDMFLDRGERVIVPDMFWGNYRLIVEVKGEGELVTFPFFNKKDDQYEGLNLDGLKQTLLEQRSRNKAIVFLNFPNNPTGYSPTVSEIEGIIQTIYDAAEQGIDILAVTDDAYFGLFYEQGTYTQSLFARLASLHERVLAVKIDGSTKEEFAWGFRVGFVTFGSKGLNADQYQALEKKLMGSIRGAVSNSSVIAQNLLIKLLESPSHQAEKQVFADELRKRYEAARSCISSADSEVLTPLPFNSGYFMSFELNGVSAEALRKKLLEQGIGTISIQDRYLRVAYSSVDLNDIEALYTEIYRAADELGEK
ncbi:MAG: aminotransferase class I/II-fold pyridoxal phosphate-dependent enzyme [Spirochaetales bacterium]|nr:aminotransferase class I/II-fold pyridoxal phosphate-dependent enzyme [Spirochaetales bacterium]MCF7938459.1 aminotransferase class I/II-fold pyridoxal phosphate-dependent enzyme [Spirochaetales bacterium]